MDSDGGPIGDVKQVTIGSPPGLATGDLSRIEERWSMLKHAVLKQMYVDGCLLYFSTDETFEDLMEVAFSENFLEEPDYSTLSLYSSLLVIRAAR